MRGERGQVLPLMAVGLLVVLLGAAGLAIDVGSWYQAKRHAQAVADAAALAAVQELPDSAAAAADVARDYAAKNEGTLADVDVDGDSLSVVANVSGRSYFARVFGFGDVTTKATAAARAASPAEIEDALPIGVNAANPALSCGGGQPCFDEDVTLVFDNGTGGVSSAWGMIDFTNENESPGTIADWLLNGYPGTVTAGEDYKSDPGNGNFASGPTRSAMEDLAARHARVALPVWSSVSGKGGTATYHIVGFAGFRIDDFDRSGRSSTINGSFVPLVQKGSGKTERYFGVKSVKLVSTDDGD